MARPGDNTRGKQRRSPWLGLLLPALLTAGLVVLVAGTLGVGAAMEESDAFCASCHSQPEQTYFNRTQAGTASDLATLHRQKDGTRCIQCHSGPGLAGRLAALRTGAGDLTAWLMGTAKQPAPLTQAIGDSSCLKCHAAVPDARSFNEHFHRFLGQWQAIDPKAATCVDCHSAHTTDGQVQVSFLNVPRTQAVCQHCHAVAGAGD